MYLHKHTSFALILYINITCYKKISRIIYSFDLQFFRNKKMKYFLICLIVFLSNTIGNSQQNVQSLVPLNFVDAIGKLNEHKIYQSNLNASKYIKILNELNKHSFDSFFKEPLHSLFEQTNLDENDSFGSGLNISKKCSRQLNEFLWALKQEEIWALQGSY